MNVRKFSAQTPREALRMVRDALGADAVILSNRSVNGSVEILALASADMASLAEPAVEREVLPQPLVAALAGKRVAQVQPQAHHGRHAVVGRLVRARAHGSTR